MKNSLTHFFAAMALTGALVPPAIGDDLIRKISGSYSEYSGFLGDSGEPTAKDMKVAFRITGSLAKNMFSHLPKYRGEPMCVQESEIRRKGDVQCTKYLPTGEIACYFGIDTRTGKSINGVVC